jgi:hypothetical protein
MKAPGQLTDADGKCQLQLDEEKDATSTPPSSPFLTAEEKVNACHDDDGVWIAEGELLRHRSSPFVLLDPSSPPSITQPTRPAV